MRKYFSSTYNSDNGELSKSISFELDGSKKRSKWTRNHVRSSWNFSVFWVFFSIMLCFVIIPFVVQWVDYGEIRNLTNIRLLFNDLTTFKVSKDIWDFDVSSILEFGPSTGRPGYWESARPAVQTTVLTYLKDLFELILTLVKFVVGVASSIIEFVVNILKCISRLISGYYNENGYQIESYWKDTSYILNAFLI